MIALEDLKEFTEQEIINHLAENYSGDKAGFEYGIISSDDIKAAKGNLASMEVLIAYESIGSWGCDSSSFFLLRDKNTKKLYEVHGSHCSCYGFEGQLDLEETTLAALKKRVRGGGVFYSGGYDGNEDANKKVVNEFISNLKQ